MTKKTIEIIINKGYQLDKVEFNDIIKKDMYYFYPNLLEGTHNKIVVEHKRKNNEYTLYMIITDGQGNEYKSYLIEYIRNTNTFKKMIKILL